MPVIDHWWQTETGWPIAANCLGIEPLPVKPGSPTKPVPGYDVRVLRESGEDAAPNETGAIAIRLPLPPGTLPTLWNDDERFVSSYLEHFPGHYVTGDGGHLDEDGYLFVMGRIDDVINVAGHRLSTGSMEEVLATHPDVAECAVIGVPDELRGEVPLGFVVLKAGVDREHGEIVGELRAAGARPGRRRGRVPRRPDRRAPAEDPLGQDPARDDALDRGGHRVSRAVHHRRSGDPRRDRRRARLTSFTLDEELVSRLF